MSETPAQVSLFEDLVLPKLYKVFGINPEPSVFGVMAEFDDGPDLVEAGRKVREAGYTKLDALTPFPVHGIDDAIGVPRSWLGYLVICIAFCGTAAAVGLMWYTGAYEGHIPGCDLMGLCSYPQVIGGKPLFDITFGLPIMFELSILFAAFASVLGMFAVNGLPQMYHPTQHYSRFTGASDDKFLLVVEATDPKFRAQETVDFLKSLGAAHVEIVEDK
jgi:Protein of unknown function (DUF3341)